MNGEGNAVLQITCAVNTAEEVGLELEINTLGEEWVHAGEFELGAFFGSLFRLLILFGFNDVGWTND